MTPPAESRDELRARLVEAYGGNDVLAEAELRFREATCAHLFCDRPAYEDGGCQARGIPLCGEHARFAPSFFDVSDARAEGERAATDRIVNWLTRIDRIGYINGLGQVTSMVAVAIERGEHLESATSGTVER